MYFLRRMCRVRLCLLASLIFTTILISRFSSMEYPGIFTALGVDLVTVALRTHYTARAYLDNLLPPQEAIRRLTTLPASYLRLTDRGLLARGKAADIVVFDEHAICDRSGEWGLSLMLAVLSMWWLTARLLLATASSPVSEPGRCFRSNQG